MVPDVYRSFAKLIQIKSGKSEQDATKELDTLIAQNRYMVDIWGISER
jgi:sulfite reductase alpha subunit-like flavoprotein